MNLGNGQFVNALYLFSNKTIFLWTERILYYELSFLHLSQNSKLSALDFWKIYIHWWSSPILLLLFYSIIFIFHKHRWMSNTLWLDRYLVRRPINHKKKIANFFQKLLEYFWREVEAVLLDVVFETKGYGILWLKKTCWF